MTRAITLNYEDDTGNPLDENDTAEPTEDDTGDFLQSLGSLFGGGGGGGLGSLLGGGGKGGSLGASLGSLAGAGLGSLVGPAGTAIGANLGKLAGGGVESLIRSGTARKPPPPKKTGRKISRRERKILAEGQEMSRRTGNPAYAEQATLRVHRPAEYKRRRAAGTLPLQRLAAAQAAQASQTARRPALPPVPHVPELPPLEEDAAPQATLPPVGRGGADRRV